MIYFSVIASNDLRTKIAYKQLLEQYKVHINESQASLIVVLGGDGFMLSTLHCFAGSDKRIFGMNCGTLGFLMNSYDTQNLLNRLQESKCFYLCPLRMKVLDRYGNYIVKWAFNEVSLLRQTSQVSQIVIWIDHKKRMDSLIGDGVIVSTPAGSTAYNLSARGPILPLSSNLLAITPLNPFRPRHWPGALISKKSLITLEVKNPEKRPLTAVADTYEVHDVVKVEIMEDPSYKVCVLFDKKYAFEERVFAEQFHYF